MLRHPCFNAEARHRWGRIHLPVAPDCNIRCAYCDRRSDCVNESRPGVSSSIMSPRQASIHLAEALAARTDISVAGIAGPGDPMACPELTLETLRLIRPLQLEACLSTNGLNLCEYVPALKRLGVRHVTLTINAVDPVIGKDIYLGVNYSGRYYRGRAGAELLLKRQIQALEALKLNGFIVKVNTVVIPGLNDGHVKEVARFAAFYGADLMNCLALIPIPGTVLGSKVKPDEALMAKVRGEAEFFVRQMRHCARCRADALGLLPPTEFIRPGVEPQVKNFYS